MRLREVADILALDAAFVGELLRLANSAMVGSRFPVSSVMQALAMLGVNRVSALATTLSLGSFLRPVASMPLLTRCWRHNLATAIAASHQADKCHLDPDQAYIHGLLHGIGTLAMLVAFPQDYSNLVDTASRTKADLKSLEIAHYGFDHVKAGTWLATAWNLPPEIAASIAGPASNSGSAMNSGMAGIVDFAWHAANDSGFAILEGTGASEPLTTDEAAFREFLAQRVAWYEKAYGSGA